MRGSLLVTFDELIDDRGVDLFSVYVNSVLMDIHYTDVNNYYSTYIFPGDVVRVILQSSGTAVDNIIDVTRIDFTTDDEGGDRGIKQTSITPTIINDTTNLLIIEFTATTRPDAYNFHYKIDASTDYCFYVGSGFSGGTLPEVTDVDVLSNGNYMISGEFTSYNGTSANRIIQLNPNGSVYSGFTSGTGFDPDTTNSVIELLDGKFVVVGQFTSYNGTSALRIIGLNSDGTVNTGFTYGTGFNQDPIASAVQSDGKILIAGIFTSYNGTSSNRIIRLNTDGTVDNTFNIGTGFDVSVTEIELQSDGKILCSGSFTTFNGNSVTGIVRLNSDGSYDNTFQSGTGLDNFATAIRVQSDGKIVLGGFFTSYSGVTSNRIIRLNSDGTIDNTFVIGTGFNDQVEDLQIQSDGKIVAVGTFTSYNGSSNNRIVRLNTDGSKDTSFVVGLGFNSNADCLAIDLNNRIVVGGGFTTYRGLSAPRITRIAPNGSYDYCPSPTPIPTSTPTSTPTPTPTQSSTPTSTPTPTPTPSITGATPTPTLTLTATATYTPTPSPSSGGISLELYGKDEDGTPSTLTLYYDINGGGAVNVPGYTGNQLPGTCTLLYTITGLTAFDTVLIGTSIDCVMTGQSSSSSCPSTSGSLTSYTVIVDATSTQQAAISIDSGTIP